MTYCHFYIVLFIIFIMIKRYGINKFMLSSFALLLICVISIIPNRKVDLDIEVEDNSKTNNVVYLLDNDNYLSLLNIYIGKNEINDIIKEKLLLLRDGYEEYDSFKPIIPKDTIINSIKVDKDTVYIDFSKEFLTIKEELEDKLIESIVYSLTEINGINNIYIYIDGILLDKFISGNIISQPLTRNIGINKEYDLVNLNNISKTTIFFIKEYDDYIYYVPVTKINNDNSEKINIIISELKSSIYSMNNLQSYLSNEVILDSYNQTEDTINLIFNDYIFESIGSNIILEEVKYTIGKSVFENYDVKEVTFSTNSINNICNYVDNN